MQLDAFPRQEDIVHGLLDERVPKPVPIAFGDQHARLDRFAQTDPERVGTAVVDLGDQVVVDMHATHSHRRDHAGSERAQALVAGQHDIAERDG